MWKLIKGAAGLLALAVVVAPPVLAQSPRVAEAVAARQEEAYTRRLESTRELALALQRVSEQQGLDRGERVAEIQRLIDQAERVRAAGRLETARVLLDAAYLDCRLAISGVVKNAPDESPPAPAETTALDDARLREAYRARHETALALRDALDRIAREKHDDPARQEVQQVDRLMAEADAQLAGPQPRQGLALLDHAYLRLKVQIERLRGGETLVRPLEFESLGAEYRYEQDRNEAFRMLIPLLVPDDEAAGVKSGLARAQALRSEADGKAAAQQFDEALRIIDLSTAAYRQLIDDGGVLLPD